MPPAEMQRLFGFASESVNMSSTLLRRRHEQMPIAMANPLDEGMEHQKLGWEALWIDVGGEG